MYFLYTSSFARSAPCAKPNIRRYPHEYRFYYLLYVTINHLGEHLQLLLAIGKEVIQPQVPLRLPCYDFTPVMNHKVVSAPPKVMLPTSFATHSHGVTGGVYKARERIHRDILIHDY